VALSSPVRSEVDLLQLLHPLRRSRLTTQRALAIVSAEQIPLPPPLLGDVEGGILLVPSSSSSSNNNNNNNNNNNSNSNSNRSRPCSQVVLRQAW